MAVNLSVPVSSFARGGMDGLAGVEGGWMG